MMKQFMFAYMCNFGLHITDDAPVSEDHMGQFNIILLMMMQKFPKIMTYRISMTATRNLFI